MQKSNPCHFYYREGQYRLHNRDIWWQMSLFGAGFRIIYGEIHIHTPENESGTLSVYLCDVVRERTTDAECDGGVCH